jgi:hypothetical protein
MTSQENILSRAVLVKLQKENLVEIIEKLTSTIQIKNEVIADLQMQREKLSLDHQSTLEGLLRQSIQTMSKDDHSTHIYGSNYGQVGQTLKNCTNMIQQQASGEKKTALEALDKEAKALIAKLPEDKKEEAAGNLELALKEATSATPRRKWYDLSAEGLIEASKFVQDFSGNIVGTLKNLGKAVWPDFSLPEEAEK